MSDQDMLGDDIDSGNAAPAPKKGGGLNILKLLMFLGIGIVGVALIVGISVITVNIVVSMNGAPQSSVPLSEDYNETPEEYAYFELPGEIKTRTVDKGNVIVKITLGYTKEDKGTPEEIGSRKFQIEDYLRNFFAKKEMADLTPSNEIKIKQELKTKLNEMMKEKGIKDVLFTRFDVIAE